MANNGGGVQVHMPAVLEGEPLDEDGHALMSVDEDGNPVITVRRESNMSPSDKRKMSVLRQQGERTEVAMRETSEQLAKSSKSQKRLLASTAVVGFLAVFGLVAFLASGGAERTSVDKAGALTDASSGEGVSTGQTVQRYHLQGWELPKFFTVEQEEAITRIRFTVYENNLVNKHAVSWLEAGDEVSLTIANTVRHASGAHEYIAADDERLHVETSGHWTYFNSDGQVLAHSDQSARRNGNKDATAFDVTVQGRGENKGVGHGSGGNPPGQVSEGPPGQSDAVVGTPSGTNNGGNTAAGGNDACAGVITGSTQVPCPDGETEASICCSCSDPELPQFTWVGTGACVPCTQTSNGGTFTYNVDDTIYRIETQACTNDCGLQWSGSVECTEAEVSGGFCYVGGTGRRSGQVVSGRLQCRCPVDEHFYANTHGCVPDSTCEGTISDDVSKEDTSPAGVTCGDTSRRSGHTEGCLTLWARTCGGGTSITSATATTGGDAGTQNHQPGHENNGQGPGGNNGIGHGADGDNSDAGSGTPTAPNNGGNIPATGGCSLVCQNGGTCVADNQNGDSCTCISPFTGLLCDDHFCTIDCGANGACEKGQPGDPSQDACVCDEGWQGELCDEQAFDCNAAVSALFPVGVTGWTVIGTKPRTSDGTILPVCGCPDGYAVNFAGPDLYSCSEDCGDNLSYVFPDLYDMGPNGQEAFLVNTGCSQCTQTDLKNYKDCGEGTVAYVDGVTSFCRLKCKCDDPTSTSIWCQPPDSPPLPQSDCLYPHEGVCGAGICGTPDDDYKWTCPAPAGAVAVSTSVELSSSSSSSTTSGGNNGVGEGVDATGNGYGYGHCKRNLGIVVDDSDYDPAADPSRTLVTDNLQCAQGLATSAPHGNGDGYGHWRDLACCYVYDHCATSPCQNGGECVADYSSISLDATDQGLFFNFACACTDEWTGTFCEELNDPCANPAYTNPKTFESEPVLEDHGLFFDEDRNACVCPEGQIFEFATVYTDTGEVTGWTCIDRGCPCGGLVDAADFEPLTFPSGAADFVSRDCAQSPEGGSCASDEQCCCEGASESSTPVCTDPDGSNINQCVCADPCELGVYDPGKVEPSYVSLDSGLLYDEDAGTCSCPEGHALVITQSDASVPGDIACVECPCDSATGTFDASLINWYALGEQLAGNVPNQCLKVTDGQQCSSPASTGCCCDGNTKSCTNEGSGNLQFWVCDCDKF